MLICCGGESPSFISTPYLIFDIEKLFFDAMSRIEADSKLINAVNWFLVTERVEKFEYRILVMLEASAAGNLYISSIISLTSSLSYTLLVLSYCSMCEIRSGPFLNRHVSNSVT